MQGLEALPLLRLTIVAEMCIKPLRFTLGKENWRMQRIVRIVPLGVAFLCAPALAEKAFSPEDAAYIDWSWKNCETTSTDKEHQLADAATASGGDKFHEEYQKSFHKLADATRPASETERLCATILGMYGPGASIIPDLIVAKGEKPPPPSAAAATPAPAAAPAPHGRKRH